jgi:hypothetical protein
MSVLLVLTTVTLMLPVPTLLVASPVPVTRDTLEMVSHVQVSFTFLLIETLSNVMFLSVPLVLTTVTLTLPVPTLLVASPAPVTKVTLELMALVQVNYIPEVDPEGFQHFD